MVEWPNLVGIMVHYVALVFIRFSCCSLEVHCLKVFTVSDLVQVDVLDIIKAYFCLHKTVRKSYSNSEGFVK